MLKFGEIHIIPLFIRFSSSKRKQSELSTGLITTTSTKPLFYNSRTLKLEDIVNMKIAEIMYKAHNRSLPPCMQELFEPRKSKYELRGTAIFKKTFARINTKQRCLSVIGVHLWNKLDTEIKHSNSLHHFKRAYKDKLINKYREFI